MSARRLRIAQVTTSDMSIRFLLMDHICALQNAGYDVTAICAPGAWVEEIRSAGVKLHILPMARELSPISDLRSLRALKKCFQENHFDVVHTHTPKAGLLGPIAARWAGVPVVVHTIHGLLFHDRQPKWKQWVYWMPEKITASFSDRLLSQSQEDMKICSTRHVCRREKVSYLGNGIDLARFTPLSDAQRLMLRDQYEFQESDFVIGSVGRLVREKGFRELFAVSEEICARFPEAKFVVVGPREEKEQRDAISSERLRELEQKGIVRFPGMQTDMQKWYGVMDAFILPSHREGVPRACMEAACMALPVIASDIRGCREVVENERTGILVPMRSSRALASAIERLLRDRAVARAMGLRGRERILQNFDSRQVIARLFDFYAGIAEGIPGERSV